MSSTCAALVTAGGTSEAVDDVRVLTNRSTGAFGAAIANALAARGVDVTLAIPRAYAGWIDPRVERVAFRSIVDLDGVMLARAARGPVDLVFMAAAVSDYAPERAEGKIRSDREVLTLTLTRTPKLLRMLRERFGPACTIVGFKLLSGVPVEHLEAVARQQIDDNGLDLSVANDAATFRPGVHPVLVVTREDAEPLSGTKEEVADAVVHRALAGRPIRSAWQALQDGFLADRPVPTGTELTPVFRGTLPVGLTAHLPAGPALWLAPRWRGAGHGDELARALGEHSDRAVCPPEDLPFWEARGFQPTGSASPGLGGVSLRTPRARADRIPAVSAALVHGPSRSVLLGERRTGASAGRWSFPGGHRSPSEDVGDAAHRELLEETGLPAPRGLPILRTPVTVGAGERAWDITCLAWLQAAGDRPEPTCTSELDARWVPFDEALAHPGLATGTRTVLRRLFSLLEWT